MHEDLRRYFEGMRSYLHERTSRDGLATAIGAAFPVGENQAEGIALYRWLVLADRRALLDDAAPLARAACQGDVWLQLTEQYIATCPTLAWDTSRYADEFAAFLASRADAGVVPRSISELAELSILRRRAFLSDVERGRTKLDRTVFVRLFSHDVRAARSGCGGLSEHVSLAERPCVLLIYRSCASGLAMTMDGTAPRIIALMDARAEPVLPEMRENVPASLRSAALVELRDAGVLPMV